LLNLKANNALGIIRITKLMTKILNMGRKLTLVLACVIAFSASVKAQQVIPLYEGTIPNAETTKNNEINELGTVSNVTVPTLTVFLPEASKNTGSAMIVCPGGAYINLAMDKEGYKVATWLAEKGITAFVLKYRTHYLGDTPQERQAETAKTWAKVLSPDGIAPESVSMMYDVPESQAVKRGYEDGIRAMELVKSRAAEFGINADKVGIMGFSAGALLSLNVALHHTPASRPAFVAPIYLGRSDKVVVPEDAAPLYLASPQNDLFTPEMTFDLYNAWTKAKVPAELHYFTGCSHGFAFENTGTPVDGWQEEMYSFMKYVGFVPEIGPYGTEVKKPEAPKVGEYGPMPRPEDLFETRIDECTSLGKKLVGVTIIPKNGPEKKPVIMFAHGYGSNKTSMIAQMTKFAAAGYICYSIDFQGGGRGVESEGESTQMSMITEKQNVLDALEMIRSWNNVDKDNIFLFGRSLGASVSMLAASEVPNKVAGVVMFYPAFCLKEDGVELFETLSNVPSEIDRMGMTIGKKFYSDIWNMDVFAEIAKYKKDVLIVHGENDPIVPVRYAQKAYDALKYARLTVIPGAGHGFKDDVNTMVEGMMLEFIQSRIK